MAFEPFISPNLQLQATTGAAGFALQNATPTILSWTAPNDGKLHRVIPILSEDVYSSMTGGVIQCSFTMPDGTGPGFITLIPAATSTGYNYDIYLANFPMLIDPGSAFTIEQSSALTAGSAKLWAEIWGA